MEKKTLTLDEIYLLSGELLGSSNPVTGEVVSKGLNSEKLGIVTKYWLTDLAKTLNDERAKIDEARNEIIKKYGIEKDGSLTIPPFIEEDGVQVANPNLDVFRKEFGELLAQTKEIPHFKFTFDHFITKSEPNGIEVEGNYPVFFGLLTPPTQ